MKKTSNNRLALSRLSATICSLAILSGCAGLPASGPEAAVRTRAQARWDALIAGDWEKAYGYTSPSYRAAVDLYRFRVKYDAFIKFRKAEVSDLDCAEQTVCKVKMKVTFTPPQDKPWPDITTVSEERWVAEDGNWWRYEEQ